VPSDYLIRPLRPEDVEAAERLTDEGFHDLDVRMHRTGCPEPTRRTPEQATAWRQRLRHALANDAGGCWVADDGSRLIGVATGLRRDVTWILSSYVVRPDVQGRGVGTQLFAAASSYGAGCLRAMISASEDPAAVRRYRSAGFDLHPTMLLRGRVPRGALPVVERVREGSVGDVDLMDSVDRQVRDSAHGADHPLLCSAYRVLVVDRSTGSGYAYVAADGSPYIVAATNRRTATDLLWEGLAGSDPEVPVTVRRVTAGNGWAIDVGMAARLELHTRGYLALRGMKPPVPYLPSGHFL
jgi:GNAT superfamily N-acetyltransferase